MSWRPNLLQVIDRVDENCIQRAVLKSSANAHLPKCFAGYQDFYELNAKYRTEWNKIQPLK